MRYVRTDQRAEGKVHVVPLHTARTLCGVDVSASRRPVGAAVLRDRVSLADGPATCSWCLDSLSDLVRSINARREAS